MTQQELDRFNKGNEIRNKIDNLKSRIHSVKNTGSRHLAIKVYTHQYGSPESIINTNDFTKAEVKSTLIEMFNHKINLLEKEFEEL